MIDKRGEQNKSLELSRRTGSFILHARGGIMIRVVLLICVSVLIITVSRKSILRPRSHGFYRFFAWELAAVLLFLNIPEWFRDPFSVRQLASWIFLALSVLLLVPGVMALRALGKPQKTETDPTRIGIERTTVLVTVSIYRYIRHPLYASLLLLVWGTALKKLTWLSLLLALTATSFTVVTARVEEAENLKLFGQNYAQYRKKTKMFIPFLI